MPGIVRALLSAPPTAVSLPTNSAPLNFHIGAALAVPAAAALTPSAATVTSSRMLFLSFIFRSSPLIARLPALVFVDGDCARDVHRVFENGGAVFAFFRGQPEHPVDDWVHEEREDPAATRGRWRGPVVFDEFVAGQDRDLGFFLEFDEPGGAFDRFVRRFRAGFAGRQV